MLAFADKLFNVTERHAKDISDQWCKAVKSITRTIGLFDQGIYIISKKYGELERVRKAGVVA